MIRSTVAVGLLALVALQGGQDQEQAQEKAALLQALPNSKHTLLEGIQQLSKAPATPISAKFEFEHGKLSLSVYTAGKGLDADAEHNVLQEHAGSPEGSEWKPAVEVFEDNAHVARSAQQQTLMALSRSSLAEVVKKAEQAQAGIVYSITPVLRGRRAWFVVLVAQSGGSVELDYDLLTGEPVKARDADAPKK